MGAVDKLDKVGGKNSVRVELRRIAKYEGATAVMPPLVAFFKFFANVVNARDLTAAQAVDWAESSPFDVRVGVSGSEGGCRLHRVHALPREVIATSVTNPGNVQTAKCAAMCAPMLTEWGKNKKAAAVCGRSSWSAAEKTQCNAVLESVRGTKIRYSLKHRAVFSGEIALKTTMKTPPTGTPAFEAPEQDGICKAVCTKF